VVNLFTCPSSSLISSQWYTLLASRYTLSIPYLMFFFGRKQSDLMRTYASTSLYTLQYCSLPCRLSILSLFSHTHYILSCGTGTKTKSCGGRTQPATGFWLVINVITSPHLSFYEHGNACSAFQESSFGLSCVYNCVTVQQGQSEGLNCFQTHITLLLLSFNNRSDHRDLHCAFVASVHNSASSAPAYAATL
jgi:hypothetical protein